MFWLDVVLNLYLREGLVIKRNFLRSICSKVVIDSHVFATLVLRSWGLVAGLCTMILVPYCLTREEQGFYFTFSSLISIQFFFDLGLNHVLSLIVSHDVALLKHSTDDIQRRNIQSRLISIRVQAGRWYKVLSTVFAISVFSVGFLFFAGRNSFVPVDWFGPWVVLCISSALNLYVSPQMAICEGFGQVDRVAALRLYQSILGNIVMWGGFLFGNRLWGLIVIPTVGAVFGFWWIKKNPPEKLFGLQPIRDLLIDSSTNSVIWRRDVFPLQWRIGLSWISGYFIFQLFNPVVFAVHGSEIAGRVGLALAACTAILGIGMSWVNASSVMMSSAIAREDRGALKGIFRKVAIRSALFTGAAALALVIVCFIGERCEYSWTVRIVDWQTFGAMGVATLVNCTVGSMAIFMRCHKEEPMVTVSVVMAFLTAAGVFWSCQYGVKLMFLIYAGLTLFVALPWACFLFRRYWLR